MFFHLKKNQRIIRIMRRNILTIILAVVVERVACIHFPVEYHEDNQQISFSTFPFTSANLPDPVSDPAVSVEKTFNYHGEFYFYLTFSDYINYFYCGNSTTHNWQTLL